jgi:hypothetical protein
MAISFDAAASLAHGATKTWSHTCASDAAILFVGVRDDSGGVTGITYNSVAMTLITSVTLTGGFVYYLYRLAAPSVGANTVSVTTATAQISGASASYKGAKMTDIPDASGTATDDVAATISKALTVVAPGSWAVFIAADRSGTNPTANTNTTSRATPGGGASWTLFDNNAAITPGSYTMTANKTGVAGCVMASFKPQVGGFFNFF